eukprot:SAG22_NODE_12829_length_427_cov_9.170732_1_plen_89_part_01
MPMDVCEDAEAVAAPPPRWAGKLRTCYCGLGARCLQLRRSQPENIRNVCINVPPDPVRARQMLQCPELQLTDDRIDELVGKACGKLAPE